MARFNYPSGLALDSDPDKNPSRERVRQLAVAVTQAHLETINAKAAYDDALKSISDDPAKLKQAVEAKKRAGFSGGSEKQLNVAQAELL